MPDSTQRGETEPPRRTTEEISKQVPQAPSDTQKDEQELLNDNDFFNIFLRSGDEPSVSALRGTSGTIQPTTAGRESGAPQETASLLHVSNSFGATSDSAKATAQLIPSIRPPALPSE